MIQFLKNIMLIYFYMLVKISYSSISSDALTFKNFI